MTEIEKLYSEAFEDGIDYAIERMFADDGKGTADTDKGTADTDKGTSEGAKKDNIFKRGWNKVKNDWWESGNGLRDEVNGEKKLNWKRLGKRASLIAGSTGLVAVPTALAIRHHNKKKAAEAEAEKNYSEGFEDGVEYAQRMYGIGDKIARKFRKLTGKETVKDRVLDLKDKAADKWNKLSKLQKAGVVAGSTGLVAVPTALAIRNRNKKAAEAED